MAIRLYRGKANILYFPKTASTALTNESVVSLSSGQLIEGTTSTTVNPGVVLRGVAATDADYAATTKLPVIMATDDVEFIADVGAGSFTASLVGTQCDLYTGAASIDVGTNTHHQVTITGYVSSSKAIIKINSVATHAIAS